MSELIELMTAFAQTEDWQAVKIERDVGRCTIEGELLPLNASLIDGDR